VSLPSQCYLMIHRLLPDFLRQNLLHPQNLLSRDCQALPKQLSFHSVLLQPQQHLVFHRGQLQELVLMLAKILTDQGQVSFQLPFMRLPLQALLDSY
jgi:hypothetical protein